MRKSKALIIIDDSAIRSKSASLAQKILRKIDRIESYIESFHNSDQMLFNNWFDLTFRNEKGKTENLNLEYKNLGLFHNWIIATSQMKNISMPEAYKLMKEEELLYSKADPSEKAKIEEERNKRDAFIRDAIEKEFREQFTNDSYYDDVEEDSDKHTPPKPRTAEEDKLFSQIRDMKDKKIHKICKDRESAFEMLSLCLGLSQTVEDNAVFLRVWEQVPHKHKLEFAKEFFSKTGESLKTVIEEMRQDIREFNEYKNEETTDQSKEEFFNLYHSSPKTKNHSAAELEEVKLIYRKLVRLLHPDLRAPDADKKDLWWQTKMWHRTQVANRDQNLSELQMLYKLTLLRQQKLNDLTISEIKESHTWLEKEFDHIQEEAKSFKRNLAWGFSRKKSYDSIWVRIKKDFDKEHANIHESIVKLKDQQAFLDFLSKNETIHRTKRRTPKRTSKHRAQKVAKTHNTTQIQFFD